MKTSRSYLAFCLVVLTPFASHAQTWVGSNTNSFTLGSNWSSSPSAPSTNGNLTFGTSSFPSVNFDADYSANSLTFTGAYLNYFLGTTSSKVLTLTGTTGITLDASTNGATAPGLAQFGSLLNITVAANQTWTTNGNLSISGNVSGGTNTLTKAGTGYLALSGNNTFASITATAGKLYLGQSGSAGSGTLTLGASATLGSVNSDVTVANAMSVASGATLGGTQNGYHGSLDLTGTVTLTGTSTPTLNVVNTDAFFSGTVVGQASTALTIAGDGTGIMILAGSVSNIDSITANNAAVAFGRGTSLPTTSIGALQGGYVSVAELGLTITPGGTTATPDVTTFLGLITNKAGFNGIIGFDTDEDATTPRTLFDGHRSNGFRHRCRQRQHWHRCPAWFSHRSRFDRNDYAARI
jgi:fibronectin-binding autotransporter adhesin